MSWFIKIIICILIGGVFGSMFLMATGTLTAKETGLLSIILFMFSILATWIVSHIYSQASQKQAVEEVKEFHQANLRTYALKAAEKVNNLSNELNLLSVYLQQELDSADYDSPDEELLAKEERLESAIHIINTLKSVNDTALSDWEGVIGDELDQQRVQREEREEDIRDLLERLESLWAAEKENLLTKQYSADSLKREFESMKKELRLLVTDTVGTPLKIGRPAKRAINEIELPCPKCGASLSYRQKAKTNSVKSLKCGSCNSQLFSRFDQSEGFVIAARTVAPVEAACPTCTVPVQIQLDTFPGSSELTLCNSCQTQVRISRTRDGIRATVTKSAPKTPAPAEPTEEIIQNVREHLPSQPWPKDIHKTVAVQLGLSNHLVYKSMSELIKRGVFKPQIDGKLYVPEQSNGDHESAGQTIMR